jgi:surfeit locus 1 family protein
MTLERLFSRQWWKTTLLVILAVVVMVRLGIWQLDRLTQRKAFNTRVEAQLAEPLLELSSTNLALDLYNMEYRDAKVSGEYDHESQVVLRNQDWQGRLGVHLLTPLIIDGSQQSVLVDRGWVPYEDFTAGKLAQYDQPGVVELNGVIRRSQTKPMIGGQEDQIPGPGEPPLMAWYWININSISDQMPYELLPVYLRSSPDPAMEELPYISQQELELTEGSHLGYAFQWFTFAAILGIGYPIFIRKEEARAAGLTRKGAAYIQEKKTTPTNQDGESKGYEKA